MIQSWSWCVWLAAALLALSTTRNPAYLLIIFLCVTFVRVSITEQEQRKGCLFSTLRLWAVVTAAAAVFNGLTSHFGNTVLLTIPGQVPLLSGSITLEALAYGAINGLVLSSLFTTFMVINQAVPARDLIALIPPAFYSLSVVVSIAVTFIPSTRRQYERIREAQIIRGRRLRGLRDALPLGLPLLIGGLERSFQLAETMTARGFSGQEAGKHPFLERLALLGGLLFMLAGWWVGMDQKGTEAGTVLAGSGGLLIAGLLWAIGRRSKRTTYRRTVWTLRDGVVLTGSAVVLAVFLLPHLLPFPSYLDYSPYPTATLPLFQPGVGMAVLALLFPAFL